MIPYNSFKHFLRFDKRWCRISVSTFQRLGIDVPCCFSSIVEALAGELPLFNGSSATRERNGGGFGETRGLDANRGFTPVFKKFRVVCLGVPVFVGVETCWMHLRSFESSFPERQREKDSC